MKMKSWMMTMAVAVWAVLPAVAQEPAAPEPGDAKADEAEVVHDPADLEIDHLRLDLRPLSKDELTTQLSEWMALFRRQVEETSESALVLYALKNEGADPEGVEVEELKTSLAAMGAREIALAKRVRLVAEELKAKGGDVAEAESYLNTVMDSKTEVDSEVRVKSMVQSWRDWIRSDDGGVLLARKLIAALVVIFIFWLISKLIRRAVVKQLKAHRRTSVMLRKFVDATIGWVVLGIGVLVAVSMLGVEITPLLAAMGAGGFIIGFALQETLGNFASGLMIMVYRPFDEEDFVTVAGVTGKVERMSLVSTTLLTIDNTESVIPNKKAWGDTIQNFTGKALRRVDLVFGIGYGDDIEKATRVLKEVASAHELVLQDKDIAIVVGSLGDSSVNLYCRPWAKTADYWTVYWDLTKQVKETFDREGISIPFPQRDVHMYREES